jgi:hypothetical protein
VEVAITVAICGAFAALMRYARGTARRKLRTAKAFAIGALPEGTAGRVAGDASALDATLQAPLTGRDCVCYVAIVDGFRGPLGWVNLITEERGVPFVLADATGRAIVDPTGAEMALEFDSIATTGPTVPLGTFVDATTLQREFLARHGRSDRWPTPRRLRYREAVICAGTRVAVLGEGVREPDPDAPPPGDYRGEATTRLRLTSTKRFPLVVGDDTDATAPH